MRRKELNFFEKKSWGMKEKNVLQNGITLIALIITITIMLIFAGVTINLTLGENGIFTIAQIGAKKYVQEQSKEATMLDDLTNRIENAANSIENDYEIFGTIIKQEEKVKYIADGEGNIIPVPEGFSPITSAEQGTKDTGFVIKNDEDGNEFVWIPVLKKDYTYNRYIFLKQIETEIDATTNSQKIKYSQSSSYYFIEALEDVEKMSVEKYGGYYIGRYETGIEDYVDVDTTQINSTNGEGMNWKGYTGYTGGKLVIQKGKQPWNYITREGAKNEAEKLYNAKESCVISRLCSSYAWDTALKFIASNKNNEEYITNSTQGNYKNSTFVYTDLNGETQIKPIESKVIVPTGQTIAVNNIYDMGGNVWEFTLEQAVGENEKWCYGHRGGNAGNYSNGFPAAYRGFDSIVADNGGGFRVTMYIK